MNPTHNKQLTFVTSPLSLTSTPSKSSTTFNGLSCRRSLTPSLFTKITPAKRQNRAARIFALGSAPTPEDKKDDDESDKDESTDKPDESNHENEGVDEVTADDILNSPSFLKKKLELVSKELIETKNEIESSETLLDAEKQRYVRLAADFENYRRRSIEDLRQSESKSTAKVCKEILAVLDNFERASAAVTPSNEKEEGIVNSFTSINKQLLDALVRLKVEPVNAIGQVFDPEVHEAIQRLESGEYFEDVVCQQYTRGYKIGDTLIRAAVVGVSAGPGPADGESPVAEDDSEPVVEENEGAAVKKEEAQQAADGL